MRKKYYEETHSYLKKFWRERKTISKRWNSLNATARKMKFRSYESYKNAKETLEFLEKRHPQLQHPHPSGRKNILWQEIVDKTTGRLHKRRIKDWYVKTYGGWRVNLINMRDWHGLSGYEKRFFHALSELGVEIGKYCWINIGKSCWIKNGVKR